MLQKREFRVTKKLKNVSFVLQKREFRVTHNLLKKDTNKSFFRIKKRNNIIINIIEREN